MACYHPKKGFVIGKTQAGKDKYKITEFDAGYIEYSHGIYYTCPGEPPKVTPKDSKIFTEFIPIPCGHCIGCRLEYARQWTCRLQCEQQMHDPAGSWFITLTYDDEKMPLECFVIDGADPMTGEHKDYLTLVPEHVTLFLKRLRQKIIRDLGVSPDDDHSLRYFLAGEYGTQRKRPHYHLIVFELPIPREWLQTYKRNEMGDMMYTCPWLEKIWSYGFVILGNVTAESIGYTARYCMKKVKDGLVYDSTHRYPEYTRMSRRPGIGLRWLEQHPEIVEIPEIIIPTSKGHQKYNLPRYFVSKLEDDDQEKLKKQRREIGQIKYQNMCKQGPYLEVLRSMELVKEAQIRKLKRTSSNT